ncbi:flagellar hook protein FlgE [Anaeromusa acidaminophila]|uniref:flagellar hook protein FlgE n=1 Tax=Anaeromusa acidaminophila TaxID=81464 RepID=UPI0003617873|nr:flagellar hook-basal body complex protein [Anaeromusa acidaminophila]
MMMSMYSAVSGLKSQQTKLNVIGNNVANINTLGYKGQSVGFSDLLSQTISSASAARGNQGGTNAKQIGLGAQVASISTNMGVGSAQYTGSDRDAALSGDGFFIVQGGGTGKYQFTRAGNFGVDVDGNLVVNGMKVCGWNDYSVAADGTITYKTTSDVAALNVFGTAQRTKTVAASATTGAISVGSLNATAFGSTVTADVVALAEDGTETTQTITFTNTDAAAPILQLKGTLKTSDTGAAKKELSLDIPKGEGSTETLKFEFVQSATKNVWNWTCGASSGTVTFDPTTGAVTGTTGDTNVQVGANTVDVNFAALTGSTTSSLSVADIDSTWTWSGGGSSGTIVYNALTGKIKSGDSGRINMTGTPPQYVDLYFNGAVSTIAAATKIEMVEDGKVGGEETVVVNKRTLAPEATTFANLAGNLDTSSTTAATTVTVFDSLGASYDVKITFTKDSTAANTWNWVTSSTDGSIGVGGRGTIEFNEDGTITSGGKGSLLIATTNGSDVISASLDLSGICQYKTSTGSSSVTVGSKDGYTSGSLQDFSIGTDGIIMGSYSNGQKQPLGDLGLAVFTNSQGLEKIGDNLYTTTVNSGDYTGAVEVGTNGAGGLTTGALEMSNVDLANEFSEMMITQRAYQANSKIITTSDTLLETLINMSR